MYEDTMIINKGYDPQKSMGSLSTPIFMTSTFCFSSAEEGEKSFRIAYGLDKKKENEDSCLIYSRVNNPNMEILEEKLSIFDRSEKSLVFSSGMAAISSTCLTFLKPNDTLFYNTPVYGGSEYLFREILPNYNINCIPFKSGIQGDHLKNLIELHKNVKMVYIETPCNPLNILTSIKDIKLNISKDILIVVDNTFNGPIYLKPIPLGADLVLYSMTKFIGGHSDLIAGCVSGSEKLISKIKGTRTIMGSILDPNSCWLVQRSLPTLKLRISKQCKNAKNLVNFLTQSKDIKKVFYPGLSKNLYQKKTFENEYLDSGSLISFEINYSKENVFKFLNSFKIIKLAVSLGSVETLIQHPSSMTHSNIYKEEQVQIGITPQLIRCSVGIEDINDIINDFEDAFKVLN